MNCKNISTKIKYICENDYKFFLYKPNVVGVGLGYKIINGFNTYRKCIKVFVSKKRKDNNLYRLIPRFYKSIETDVVESGFFKTNKLISRVRPVLGGYNIGPKIIEEGGTMGCLVTDGHDKYILSCNHILADYNKFPLTTPILQPSGLYGGTFPKDTIAGLSQYVPINLGSDNNLVDCAIARVLNKSNVSSKIALIGNIKGLVEPKLGEKVKKTGAITELTFGKITAINVVVHYSKATFKDQIVTTSMAKQGDSGAILLNNKNYGIGLLVGGTDTHVTYNKLSTVLRLLSVTLVTG